MKRINFICLAIVAMSAQFAQAQDITEEQFVSFNAFNSLDQRLLETSTELDYLRGRVEAMEQCTTTESCCSQSSCCEDSWMNPCAGLVAEVQWLQLRPSDSEPNSGGQASFHTGSRTTIGYLDSNGRGVRVRYFEYTDDSFAGAFLDLEAIDVEYVGRFRLGQNWHGELMGGVRSASYHDDELDYANTIGPMIGAALRGTITDSLSFYGLARQSIQFGTPNGNFDRGNFGITELQSGLEYKRSSAGSSQFFARLFLEGQNWTGAEDNDSEDLGMVGWGLSAGITR